MRGKMKMALHVDESDNVATVFENNVRHSSLIDVRNRAGESEIIEVLSDIPYGHKIATRDIKKGESVIKYGQRIGIAGIDIKKGDYVHVHNMEAARGRGDLEAAK